MSGEWRKCAALGVEAKRGHRGIELIGDEHQRQCRGKREVPRTRTGAHYRVTALDMSDRLPTFRRLLVQSGERASISGDREGAYRTSCSPFVFLELVDGVEQTPVGVDREEGGVRAGIHRAHLLQLAGASVNVEQIDPFTPCA